MHVADCAKATRNCKLPPLDAYAARGMSHVLTATQPACAFTLLPVYELPAKAVRRFSPTQIVVVKTCACAIES